MAGFNGSGTFVRTYNWVTDKSNSVLVTASRFDTEDDGFAAGLSTAICKDGQQTTTAVIPFAVGLKVNDGSTSSPPLAFTSETNTGIYRPGTGQLGITVLGGNTATFGTATATFTNLTLTNALPVLYGGTGDTGTAWSTYSATATGTFGAIGGNSTTTGAQKSLGKTQFFSISSVLASATVGVGGISINAPATANRATVVTGWNVTDGYGVTGSLAANSTTITILPYNGSFTSCSGKTIVLAGVYEKQ